MLRITKLFRRPLISLVYPFLKKSTQMHHITKENFGTKIWPLCHVESCLLCLSFFFKMAPQMLCITNTKLFRGPNILIQSMYPNVHTKKSSFFWTPCMAEIAFYELILSIFEKGSTNLPHHKGKTVPQTQYFDHFHTYQFLHQNKSILHFSDTLYG